MEKQDILRELFQMIAEVEDFEVEKDENQKSRAAKLVEELEKEVSKYENLKKELKILAEKITLEVEQEYEEEKNE